MKFFKNAVRTIIASIFIFSVYGCDSEIREGLLVENKVMERISTKKEFPNQVKYGFSYNNDSPFIRNDCPKIDNGPDYINIEIDLSREINPEEIAYFAIYIHKKRKNNKTDTEVSSDLYELVFDRYFYPNGYNNKLRFSNYFPTGDYKMNFGFFLRGDSTKAYPLFYKKSCTFKII